MKLLKKITIGMAIVCVFCFLLLKANEIDFNRQNEYVMKLREINELDARINENVLQAESGLLNNYDPIVNNLKKLDNILKELKNIPNFIEYSGEIKERLQAYTVIFKEKEQLIEYFNAENAIVRNSLAYLPIAIADTVEIYEKDDELVNRLHNLLRDILIYNISPSEELISKIGARIQIIENLPLDLEIPIVHARILLQHQPEVNNLIRSIINLPTPQLSEQLSAAYDRSYALAIKRTNYYRFWLFLYSVIVVIAIAAYIIFKLMMSEEMLRREQEKAEGLLLNILPKAIADRLKKSDSHIAEQFDATTILFADIVGFTPLSARMSPIELVNLLNRMFSKFDKLAEKHGLEKIKTIGDAYMVAGGLPVPRDDHAEAVAQMALDMQFEINRFQADMGESFQIRIGINTGPAVAGVIGLKKFIYDLWGDTVNVASRMESSGIPGRIQVTATTYEILKDKFLFEKRGAVLIKGKGEMITYWLLAKKLDKINNLG